MCDFGDPLIMDIVISLIVTVLYLGKQEGVK